MNVSTWDVCCLVGWLNDEAHPVCVRACARALMPPANMWCQGLYTDGKVYILVGSEVCGHRSVEVLFCHFPLRTKKDLEKSWYGICFGIGSVFLLLIVAEQT
jgi:hypothetical protein